MGWDSERLSNLPKVTKLIKGAEPLANSALKGSRARAIDHCVSLPRSQTQDLGQVVHLPFSGSGS